MRRICLLRLWKTGVEPKERHNRLMHVKTEWHPSTVRSLREGILLK